MSAWRFVGLRGGALWVGQFCRRSQSMGFAARAAVYVARVVKHDVVDCLWVDAAFAREECGTLCMETLGVFAREWMAQVRKRNRVDSASRGRFFKLSTFCFCHSTVMLSGPGTFGHPGGCGGPRCMRVRCTLGRASTRPGWRWQLCVTLRGLRGRVGGARRGARIDQTVNSRM